MTASERSIQPYVFRCDARPGRVGAYRHAGGRLLRGFPAWLSEAAVRGNDWRPPGLCCRPCWAFRRSLPCCGQSVPSPLPSPGPSPSTLARSLSIPSPASLPSPSSWYSCVVPSMPTAYWPAAGHRSTEPGLTFFYGILSAAMVLVVVARNGVLFLIAWEIMALAGYFLLATEHGEEGGAHGGHGLPGRHPCGHGGPDRAVLPDTPARREFSVPRGRRAVPGGGPGRGAVHCRADRLRLQGRSDAASHLAPLGPCQRPRAMSRPCCRGSC